MLKFLSKLRGDGAALPPRAPARQIALAWLGGFLAIGSIALSADLLSASLLLGSFGASCVLVFGFPDLPFSQPRNVLLGPGVWSLAIAVGSAIALMMLTRSVHPPAGSNPVIIFLTQPGWSFLLFPTLSGALILILVALLYNNATRPGRYPKYW